MSVKWSAILSLPVNHMCHFVLCYRNSALQEWTRSGLRKVHFVASTKLNLNCNKLTSLPHLCPLKCCLVNLLIAHNDITTLSKQFFQQLQKAKPCQYKKTIISLCYRIYIRFNIQYFWWGRQRIRFSHWVRWTHPAYTKDYMSSTLDLMLFVLSISLSCVTCQSWVTLIQLAIILTIWMTSGVLI